MISDISFLVVSYLAAVMATLAGFGSSTLLIPVGLMFTDAKTTIFLVACFHLFNNIFKVNIFWNKIDFKVFLLFGLFSILFAFLGALGISFITLGILKKTIGCFLLFFAGFSFLNPKFSLKKTPMTSVLGGSLSGLLAGLIGLGGAIRSVFLFSYNLEKETYIATSAMIALIVDITRVPTYIFTTVLDKSRYLLLPFLLISAYFGVRTGKLFLTSIDQAKFRKVVLVAILLISVKLILW